MQNFKHSFDSIEMPIASVTRRLFHRVHHKKCIVQFGVDFIARFLFSKEVSDLCLIFDSIDFCKDTKSCSLSITVKYNWPKFCHNQGAVPDFITYKTCKMNPPTPRHIQPSSARWPVRDPNMNQKQEFCAICIRLLSIVSRQKLYATYPYISIIKVRKDKRITKLLLWNLFKMCLCRQSIFKFKYARLIILLLFVLSRNLNIARKGSCFFFVMSNGPTQF